MYVPNGHYIASVRLWSLGWQKFDIIIFLYLNYFKNDSDDSWNWKFTFKVRLWHFLRTHVKVWKFQNFFRSYFGQCDDFIFSFWNFLTFSLSTIIIIMLNCELWKKNFTHTQMCAHTPRCVICMRDDFWNVLAVFLCAAFFGCTTCDCNFISFWAKKTRFCRIFFCKIEMWDVRACGRKIRRNSQFNNFL